MKQQDRVELPISPCKGASTNTYSEAEKVVGCGPQATSAVTHTGSDEFSVRTGCLLWFLSSPVLDYLKVFLLVKAGLPHIYYFILILSRNILHDTTKTFLKLVKMVPKVNNHTHIFY